MLAAVVHRNDVRMVQPGGRACLYLEAPTVVGLPAERRMQQLDRDWSVQSGVPAVANLGHPAAAQNPPQFIAAAKNFWRLHSPTLGDRRRAARWARRSAAAAEPVAGGYHRGDALPARSSPVLAAPPLGGCRGRRAHGLAAVDTARTFSSRSSGSHGSASPYAGAAGPTRYAMPGYAPVPSTNTG